MCQSQEPRDVFNDYARTLIRVKACQLARRAEFRSSDRHDIEQDLWVYLLSQAERFDPSRASINTFIARIIDTGVAMLVRQQQRRSRLPDAEAQSLDMPVDGRTRTAKTVADTLSVADVDRRTGRVSKTVFEAIEDNDAWQQAWRMLSPDQRAICGHVANGNPTRAARALGLSRRQLSGSLDAIRARLEEAGF